LEVLKKGELFSAETITFNIWLADF
jgi:hypothetical protein